MVNLSEGNKEIYDECMKIVNALLKENKIEIN